MQHILYLYLHTLTSLVTPFVIVVLEDPALAPTEPFRSIRDLTSVIVCISRTADGWHHQRPCSIGDLQKGER